MKIVMVTGGRDFGRIDPKTPLTFPRKKAERRFVAVTLGVIRSELGKFTLIQGGATGADAVAREWAAAVGAQCETYEANWLDLSYPDALIKVRRDGTRYDARAGFRRNQKMIDLRPDLVVAFPGGRGTADAVERAIGAGIEVRKVEMTAEGKNG